MSTLDLSIDSFVTLFWVIALFLFLRLVLNRVKPSVSMLDWDYRTKINEIPPRSNLITLMKIYNTIRQSTPRELAMNIRDELTGNAALAYDKPNAFFVKYRSDREVMRSYFKDKELRFFFANPRQWAIHNGGVQISFFGLVVNENKATKEYFDNLARIIKKFEKQLAGIKKEQI